jgi:hypothetical protein
MIIIEVGGGHCEIIRIVSLEDPSWGVCERSRGKGDFPFSLFRFKEFSLWRTVFAGADCSGPCHHKS